MKKTILKKFITVDSIKDSSIYSAVNQQITLVSAPPRCPLESVICRVFLYLKNFNKAPFLRDNFVLLILVTFNINQKFQIFILKFRTINHC